MKCPHCGKDIASRDLPTPIERTFVAYWLTNGNNGTDAARSAGYKGKTDKALGVTASRVLARVRVRTLIDQMRLPAREVVQQTLREVALTGEKNERVASARVLARIEGMIAPTRHEHAHLHAHLDLPAAGTPEAAEHALRSVRALVPLLSPPDRARLLRDLGASGEVPALPRVREVHRADGESERERTGEAEGGGSLPRGVSDGPS
ncbi:MAG TPA: terminase small subunit [Planctomycetota bacterium]|nr:terminase small subunit [Planctomycetota bacterium]